MSSTSYVRSVHISSGSLLSCQNPHCGQLVRLFKSFSGVLGEFRCPKCLPKCKFTEKPTPWKYTNCDECSGLFMVRERIETKCYHCRTFVEHSSTDDEEIQEQDSVCINHRVKQDLCQYCEKRKPKWRINIAIHDLEDRIEYYWACDKCDEINQQDV